MSSDIYTVEISLKFDLNDVFEKPAKQFFEYVSNFLSIP